MMAIVLIVSALRLHDLMFLAVAFTGWVGNAGSGISGGSFLK